MSNRQVFILQMLLSALVYSLIANWYIAPALAHLPQLEIFGYLLLPHALRHIGLTAIVPAVVDPNVPKEWSRPVGYGDLLTQVVAMLAILAIRCHWSFAIVMVWIANIVGFGDFVYAGIVATKYKAYNYQLGGFWFLPTFFVPILIVTHFWMFWMLCRR